MAYSIQDFTKEFYEIKETSPTYRVGQFFITKFIKDSTSEEMQELWNEEFTTLAFFKINEIIERWDWDYNDLPILIQSEVIC